MAILHRIIHENLNMRKIYAKSVSSVLSNKQKEIHIGDSREMVELITSDPTLLGSLVTSEESRIYCYEPETKRQSAQLKHPDSQTQEGQAKQVHREDHDPLF